jgi:hypothetical protein
MKRLIAALLVVVTTLMVGCAPAYVEPAPVAVGVYPTYGYVYDHGYYVGHPYYYVPRSHAEFHGRVR